MVKGKMFLILFFAMTASTVIHADESFFLDSMTGCKLLRYENGKMIAVDRELVSARYFTSNPMARNPELSLFKIDGSVYVTKTECLGVKKKPINAKPEELTFNDHKYFIETGLGVLTSSGSGTVVENYNQVFPSTTSNPTSWGSPTAGTSSNGTFFTAGFGERLSRNSYLHFKIHIRGGEKHDEVTLTDLNTGLTQTGTWKFKDSFTNGYVGFRILFLKHNNWKASIGFYAGISFVSTILTDNVSTYKLSSISPALLLEGGTDYLISTFFGISANLGYEQLGVRSMKFSSETEGHNFKTKVKYDNLYFLIGPKYYF